MARRTRWIFLALVLTQRPKLVDARDHVDATWVPLRAPDQLRLRYQTLTGALSAFDAAGGTDRTVSKDLHAALDHWDATLRTGDAGDQAHAANAVEAQGSRLVANALGAARFKSSTAITDALTKFATTVPNATLVDAYNRAVHEYQDVRTQALAQPVARVTGFDARPVFELGTDSVNH